MKNFYSDCYENLEDDEIFDDENYYEDEDEESYPSVQEYNRINKHKYDKF